MQNALSPRHDAVAVYYFERVDPLTAERRVSTFKTTRTEIEQTHAGVVLEGTREDVGPSELDEDGRYRRVATGWGALD